MVSGVKSQAPVVSAMMPAYNVEKYIGEAIESVLYQTFGDWELIIVDDGSQDRTPEIIRQYARRDPRIRAYSMEHGGRGRARNRCLELSRGRYIAVCDSDDISLPQRFEKEVAFLDEKPDYGVVSAQSEFFWDTDRPRPVIRYSCDTGEIRRRFNRGTMGINHAASMFRKELVDRIGPYRADCLRAQDLEFFLRANEVTTFFNLPEVLLHYRNDPKRITYALWATLGAYRRYGIYCRDCFRKRIEAVSFPEFDASNRGLRHNVFDAAKFIIFRLRMSFK